ncbi:hypothetical protein AB0A60_30585 [Streptomyces sp. NPDC046275]|uniref:hypothetical protein n=1 Tax=Streptomyces sp. NPDC046275 TaxID=3157201 RepID=UPI0033C5432B
MTRDVHEELRARLRAAAEEHRPDRARILARVERGMAGQAASGRRAPRRPASGRLRFAGVAAAVAGVLAVAGFAVAAAVREEPRLPQGTVSMPPVPAPSPTATGRPSAGPAEPTSGPERGRTGVPRPSDGGAGTAAPPSRSPSPGRSATTAPSAPPPVASGVADGPLWSDGSVDPHSNEFWAQSNVTLKTRTPLTALTVRLRIAQTGGVASTGAWRSLPEQDFSVTVEERDGFLEYTWVLREGRTVPAGEFVFAGQYDHRRGGRDAADDRYTATASTGTERLAVAGDFARHSDG